MVNAQRTRMLDASAPNPSVETLLHAFLPHKFIDHSHADFDLEPGRSARRRAACAASASASASAIVPYIMPGFALAKLAAEVYEQQPEVEGLLLLQHGLFTFGHTARESYERHVRAVSEAEELCARRRYWSTRRRVARRRAPALPYARARAGAARAARRGRRGATCCTCATSAEIHEFVDDPQARGAVAARLRHARSRDPHQALSRSCCASPHGARSRTRCARASRERLAQYRARVRELRAAPDGGTRASWCKPLDPDPRVILVPGLGPDHRRRHARRGRASPPTSTSTRSRDPQRRSRSAATRRCPRATSSTWSTGRSSKPSSARASPSRSRARSCTSPARRAASARRPRARSRSEGAVLYLVDREAEPLAALARELELRERGARPDATSARCGAASSARCETHGGLDGVVSNAGIAPQGAIDSVQHRAAATQSFAINFYAHHWVASAAVAVMKRAGPRRLPAVQRLEGGVEPGRRLRPVRDPQGRAGRADEAVRARARRATASAATRSTPTASARGLLDAEDIAAARQRARPRRRRLLPGQPARARGHRRRRRRRLRDARARREHHRLGADRRRRQHRGQSALSQGAEPLLGAAVAWPDLRHPRP